MSKPNSPGKSKPHPRPSWRPTFVPSWRTSRPQSYHATRLSGRHSSRYLPVPSLRRTSNPQPRKKWPNKTPTSQKLMMNPKIPYMRCQILRPKRLRSFQQPCVLLSFLFQGRLEFHSILLREGIGLNPDAPWDWNISLKKSGEFPSVSPPPFWGPRSCEVVIYLALYPNPGTSRTTKFQEPPVHAGSMSWTKKGDRFEGRRGLGFFESRRLIDFLGFEIIWIGSARFI